MITGCEMNSKKDENQKIGKGMSLVKGGLNYNGKSTLRGCICSPGGEAGGNASGNGCACGCLGPSSPADNLTANQVLAN